MAVVDIVARVQQALEDLGTHCPMEEVVGLCPELTWNQVFVAIDYLSRTGQVSVTLDPGRTYRVQAQNAPVSRGSASAVVTVDSPDVQMDRYGRSHQSRERASMHGDSVQSTDERGSHTNTATAITDCTHSRMVDSVLTTSKKRTGKLCCLECDAVFDDLSRAEVT